MILVFNFSVVNAKSFQIENDSIKKSISNTISFAEVDVPPLFAGCSKWKEDCEQRNCFDRSIIKFVKNHVEKKLEQERVDVSLTLRTTLQFVIDSVGGIKKIEAIGEDEVLNRYSKEAILRLSKTPRILRGKHQGKPVDVFYSIKIKAESFEKMENKRLIIGRDYEVDLSDTKLYHYVIHPDCRKTGKPEKDRRCLSQKIKKYVNKNFDGKLGDRLGLYGINRIFVRFMISKCGNIVDVRARGPHPALEKEAIRVIKTLPKMEPAQIRNENVNVTFSLPIIYQKK
ncbi:energy transducer TonB [Aquimarina sp. 2304DJ70-9]|uniref:energy transducer TonB n=1 Tax=Aquimarina penaris TaxID=3231044 RepID=UPI003462E497